MPDAESRLWRTGTRRKHQLTRDRVRLQNQLEALLEEAHIKLSSCVSDLLGQSALRILTALVEGKDDPMSLAALADRGLKATPEQLGNALAAVRYLNPVCRQIRKMLFQVAPQMRVLVALEPVDLRKYAPSIDMRNPFKTGLQD